MKNNAIFLLLLLTALLFIETYLKEIPEISEALQIKHSPIVKIHIPEHSPERNYNNIYLNETIITSGSLISSPSISFSPEIPNDFNI